jgi:phosphoribosylamine-glycine ligase
MNGSHNNEKPVALVLGGTSPHVELIKKLKNRGYQVILIDYLDNSPGIAYADRHIKESTLDAERVLQIARDTEAALVISTCIDQANSTCCYVAEQLGLPHPYDYKTSLDVTDKGRMKKIMREHGIPTSPYILVTDEQKIAWDQITFPVVVKPVDCNSSKGVHRADKREEVLYYVKEALALSRAHHAIVEGFNAGVEIQVDCMALEEDAKVLMTRQKKTISGENGMVLQSLGSVIPASLDSTLLVQAEQIAVGIARAFGLKNTPFFYQAIITREGISVLEFAPRIGGGLSYYLLRKVAGVDVVECAIDSFLGNKIKLTVQKNPHFFSTSLLYMKAGVFDRIEGFEQLKEQGVIRESFQMKKSGTVIDDDLRSGNRVGAVVIEADSLAELRLKEQRAWSQIRVLNAAGEECLNRDLHVS